jgi:hypothetical protein
MGQSVLVFYWGAMKPQKEDWIETAIKIRQFHIDKLKLNNDWRVQDTATELKRSFGSVQQYIMIGVWLKTYENQIRRLDTMKEAVEFIKKKKREMEVEL